MKKISMILMAFALAMMMSQCKKNEGQTTSNDEVVTITLDVKQNNGSKVVVNPNTGTVDFETGDKIYVGSGGKYVGFLTHNGTNFSGNITNPTENQPLQFYFLGNVTPQETLSAGTTEECSVIISDQTEHLPVISCAASIENYVSGVTAYSAHLLNKCALVKFNVTTISEAATCITGMNNKVTVDFETNDFDYNQEGDGVITLSAGEGEKWAILLPQNALEAGENGTVYSEDGVYEGIRPEIPAIIENGYLKNGINITLGYQVLPSVVTSEITSITINSFGNSAIGGGEVISQGGSDVTQRGICWSTSSNPDLSDNVSSENLGLGSYSLLITGIELGSTYYVRAFATNEYGTAFGEEVSFTVGIGALYEFDDGSEGIIYYIDQNMHGLVVSLDQDFRRWSNRQKVDIQLIPNEGSHMPTALHVGLGLTYTNAMINQVGASVVPAAAWCRSMGTEWYLPSCGEIVELASVRNVVNIGLSNHGGIPISEARYWSSSEFNAYRAWRYYFGGGGDQFGWLKQTEHYVRAVRMF